MLATRVQKNVLRNIVSLSVGRLQTHPSGEGYVVRVPGTKPGEPITEIEGFDGKGLTKAEAEEVLDRLDNFIASRN